MDIDAFKKHGHDLIDWIAGYYAQMESFPVKSGMKPGDVFNKIPDHPPQNGTGFEQIMHDFNSILLPGITHWQHPSFFAYFNANTSFPSILGELLSSAIGAQCMIWETSPAAAELEEKVCNWLRDASGLPVHWQGVIQDTASTATLCALLMAREKYSDFEINRKGFYRREKFTIYCSTEAHSSIEKDVKIAGFGSEQLRKIEVDDQLAMIPQKLEAAIRADQRKGFVPLCVIAAVGTTGTHAMDPLPEIGHICKAHKLFFHVDAAHAGNAAILPECRQLFEGVEMADSYVFNPHKWMFTNFDCTLFYVADKGALIRTFEILPEYLKTQSDHAVNNYRDWGIQLGRRFRALKLWMVLRSYGVEGIREKFREHISLAHYLKKELEADAGFEVLAPVPLNLVCFRFHPEGADESRLEQLNIALEQHINASGKAYISHTRIDGKYTLRACIGQTNVNKGHVDAFIQLLKNEARKLK